MADFGTIIEALIFASDFPLSVGKIAEILGIEDKQEAIRQVEKVVKAYEERDGGVYIHEVAGGYQFRTRSNFAPWIKKLKGIRYSLSPASMETLAIIAYRQPVIKSEIDGIRGVDAGGPIKRLLEKKLVRIMGRKDIPGRPIIYGTTKRFLEVFNLNDLSELPTLQELKELEE